MLRMKENKNKLDILSLVSVVQWYLQIKTSERQSFSAVVIAVFLCNNYPFLSLWFFSSLHRLPLARSSEFPPQLERHSQFYSPTKKPDISCKWKLFSTPVCSITCFSFVYEWPQVCFCFCFFKFSQFFSCDQKASYEASNINDKLNPLFREQWVTHGHIIREFLLPSLFRHHDSGNRAENNSYMKTCHFVWSILNFCFTQYRNVSR